MAFQRRDSNCHGSVTFEENIMEIIKGYLAKNPVVMGNWSDKDADF